MTAFYIRRAAPSSSSPLFRRNLVWSYRLMSCRDVTSFHIFVACELSLIRDMNINETSKWLDVIVGRLFAKENFIRRFEIKSSMWEEILYLSSSSYCFSPETLRHIGLKKHCSDHLIECTS